MGKVDIKLYLARYRKLVNMNTHDLPALNKVSDYVRHIIKLNMFSGASMMEETDCDILRVPGDVDNLFRLVTFNDIIAEEARVRQMR